MLEAAIGTHDPDVSKSNSRRNWTGSLVSCLVSLEPGEAHIRNRELIGFTFSAPNAKAELVRLRKEFSNGTFSSIRNARQIIGGDADFTTETSEILTPSGRMFMITVITRIDVTSSEDDI